MLGVGALGSGLTIDEANDYLSSQASFMRFSFGHEVSSTLLLVVLTSQ